MEYQKLSLMDKLTYAQRLLYTYDKALQQQMVITGGGNSETRNARYLLSASEKAADSCIESLISGLEILGYFPAMREF